MSEDPARADDEPGIAIVGAGTVGTALGVLAARAGWRIVAVASRTRARAENAARRIGPEVEVLPQDEAVRRADWVFLTVSDGAIEEVCEALSRASAIRPGALVAHFSGALTSEVLRSARGAAPGCRLASCHPLQTFASLETALENLPGSFCFIEGDPAASAPLERFVAALGARSVPIATEAKVLYHAAAVIACNDLTALMDAALAAHRLAGIDPELAWPALQPLVQATIANIGRLGTAGALTGPVARGDVETVRAHLEALEGRDADLEAVYRALGRWTLRLARQKGSVGEQASGELDALFLQDARTRKKS